MKGHILLTLIAILAVFISAEAQLGDLKNKIKDKVKTETDKTKESAQQPSQNSNNSASANNPGQTSPGGTQFDSQFPPGILFSSLLNGMRILPDGRLRFVDLNATFLPPTQSRETSELPYNPRNGGKLDSVIKTVDGRTIATQNWFAKPGKNPFWIMDSYLPEPFIKTAPGSYLLEFQVAGKTFYRFPFSIVKEGAGDDPFAAGAGEKFVLKGAWEDYGYLHFPASNPSNTLQYRSWFRAPQKKGVDIAVELVRASDGKKIAESNPNASESLTVGWEPLSFDLLHPNGSGFRGHDLLKTDGNYKIVVKIDGKPYGNYPFSVQGGKIQYLPEQRRGETDQLTLVEGGNDSWFVKKGK